MEKSDEDDIEQDVDDIGRHHRLCGQFGMAAHRDEVVEGGTEGNGEEVEEHHLEVVLDIGGTGWIV